MAGAAHQFVPELENDTRGTSFVPRKPIGLRDWSRAQRLLRQYRITNREISDETDVPLGSVSRALNLKKFHACSHLQVMAVRSYVEVALSEAGCEYDGSLWSDYEQRLAELM